MTYIVGRWWLVGSNWSDGIVNQKNKSSSSDIGAFDANLLALARAQGMNTEVRKVIFCIIMTSEAS